VSPFFPWGPGYYYTPPLGDAYQPNGYWYYCQSAGAYYPYVACPEAWVPIPAS